MRGGRVGGDDIGNSLGLRQVHLPVQEGPAREFSGLGKARACFQKEPHQLLNNVGRCVCGNLHRIFSGVAVRGAEHGYHHLVQAGHLSVVERIAGGLGNRPGGQPYYGVRDAERFRSADADNGNCSGTRNGGRSNDGVCV